MSNYLAQQEFDFVAKEDLPIWTENGLQMTLVAGEGYGKKSPLSVYSPLFMIDVQATEKTCLDIKSQLSREIAFVVTNGQVTDGNDTINAGQMLISKTENECYITLEANTRLLLFGGKPLDEPRYLFWNFVSSSKTRLEQAKDDWKNKRFLKVTNDETYIPLPPIQRL